MKKIVLLSLSLIMLAACSNETKKEVKTKETSTTITSTSKGYSSKTKEKESGSTTETSNISLSSVENQNQTQVSLGDFVGGWGIPQSDNLFFINADGTFTSNTQSNIPLQNLSFSVDENGNKMMSYVLNNTPGTLVKNTDGSLSASGQVYSYLGNITMDQLIERNNQGQQATTTDGPSSSETNNSKSAITESNSDSNEKNEAEYNSKVNEIETYYSIKRQSLINEKRQQIKAWKSSGEVDWPDEIIEQGLADFENRIYSAFDYSSQVDVKTQNEIKEKIDHDFNFLLNNVMIK
ncbi:DUF4950 domain-containing protein [Enterococcus faecalis]|uniref:DUF4950 domain-containing protein n=1 Tax=Enterococcus faecalis TaxID=1351 RepID=UPI001D161355|nr:DUF4950 domain-containing protein [Enterococcus faecalis]